ncbi:homeobox and C2H2 transcription factor [Colletotrichum filicis]|nr:homeobox and C2H2 transcription factor [Colletotrichum filicis]
MGTWAIRTDHLTDHFKEGKSMADWQGDWGFDQPVLNMLENSMHPYLIHYERHSPWPFTTQQGPVETPINAYELIKLELKYWMGSEENLRCPPSSQGIQFESCCIILGSDMLSDQPEKPEPSWLRDLLMSSPEMVQKARTHPTKTTLKPRITQLRIHGKRDIFESCGLEDKLQEFVNPAVADGLDLGDFELQVEASRIISTMEFSSCKPWTTYESFLHNLIYASTQWLLPFRSRTSLALRGATGHEDASCDFPPSMEATDQVIPMERDLVQGQSERSEASLELADSAALVFQNESNCYRRLARELSRYVSSALSPRNPAKHLPSDEELQNQARWIMYEDDDPWNQTPADNPDWLRDFKRTVGLLPQSLE